MRVTGEKKILLIMRFPPEGHVNPVSRHIRGPRRMSRLKMGNSLKLGKGDAIMTLAGGRPAVSHKKCKNGK
jgi:hypothetical protein